MFHALRRKLTPYSIDILNREYASGWCFNRLRPDSAARISFRLNGKTVGETRADQLREDLVDHGVHASGQAGFVCHFSPPLVPGDNDKLTFHVNGSPLPLATFPGERVLEVFRPDERPLFFMHIPKTAGTSFNNFIRQYFGYGLSHTHIQTTPLAQQREMARSGHFLSGHITLEHIPAIFGDRPVDLHTIVRQPLKQLHSHVGWVKGIALHPDGDFFRKHHQLVQEMGQDLFQTDLSRPENLRRLVDNLDGFQIDFFDNIQTRYFLDYRPDRVGRADLERAIDNIARFRTIGLTERFADYTAQFCDACGIARQPVVSRHNPSRVRPLFDIEDEKTRAALRPLVEWDIELYRAIEASSAVTGDR